MPFNALDVPADWRHHCWWPAWKRRGEQAPLANGYEQHHLTAVTLPGDIRRNEKTEP
jgi:hypothetical protein